MDRLDFRRSLVSGLPSPRTAFGEERGLISRAAADNRANDYSFFQFVGCCSQLANHGQVPGVEFGLNDQACLERDSSSSGYLVS